MLRLIARRGYRSLMEALLTFEVFRGMDTETNAETLRGEIEAGLVKLNWDHQDVHTTFAKHWTDVIDNRTIEHEFAQIVGAAHKSASITSPMRVEYGALIGPGPIISARV
jgi:hypothetical protein